MSTNTILSSIAGLSLIAVSSLGNAMTANPLSPGFQKYAVIVEATGSANAARYVDTANPLTPTFTRIGDNSKWTTTTLRADQLYRDTANPLHPGFKRI